MSLKEYAHPNWDSDISCNMSAENNPIPYKQNMQTMFKFTKNNLEDMFFNASDLSLSWFTKGGISDTILFYKSNKIFISIY